MPEAADALQIEAEQPPPWRCFVVLPGALGKEPSLGESG
jgi:hypothetical protein